MKGTFKLVNPDSMQASLTITMTIQEWRKLRSLIPEDYPGWKINSMIRNLISQAEETFDETVEIDP